jgi:hypothetical protein
MTAIDCIALSLSVPLPEPLRAIDVVRLVEADAVDARSRVILEAFLTEISQDRIAEAVLEGSLSFGQIVHVAEANGLRDTPTARWSREMSGS